MRFPPPDPKKIARILRKDCGIRGGIKYAESIIRGASSPQYRRAYREAKQILVQHS